MAWDALPAALPARMLDKDELRALVDDVAAHPELWSDQLAFPPAGEPRYFACLYRDEYVDVQLLCWSKGHDTGWHDHDVSAGAVHVVSGAVAEHNPRLSGDHMVTVMTEGRSFSFGAEHIHRLCGDRDISVTIHAYSPPVGRLGAYAFDANDVMRRVAVSPAEPLRPLDPVA